MFGHPTHSSSTNSSSSPFHHHHPHPFHHHHLMAMDHQNKMDKLDPMQNQLCRVCDEPAAGFHFGAFTCEGCKSFFGRTCNNQSVIQECKNNYQCVINKKNRTACKACRLKKCLMVGMSKSGSRYGRRSNWFKIHVLMQNMANGASSGGTNNVTNITAASTSPLPPSLQESKPPPPRPSPPVASTSSSPGGLWRPLDLLNTTTKTRTPPPSPPGESPVSPPKVSRFSDAFGSSQESSDRKITSPPDQTASSSASSSFGMFNPFLAQQAFFPPTFNFPALASLPIHKQAMLSPLLASTHMLAAAAMAANAARKVSSQSSAPSMPYSLVPPSPSQSVSSSGSETVLAEHRALLERFRLTLQQHQEQLQNMHKHHHHQKLTEEDHNQDQSREQNNNSNVKPHAVDLTKRGSSDGDDDSASSSSSRDSMGSEIIPNLSDTDDEQDAVNHHETSRNNPEEDKTRAKNKTAEKPLDLTRVFSH